MGMDFSTLKFSHDDKWLIHSLSLFGASGGDENMMPNVFIEVQPRNQPRRQTQCVTSLRYATTQQCAVHTKGSSYRFLGSLQLIFAVVPKKSLLFTLNRDIYSIWTADFTRLSYPRVRSKPGTFQGNLDPSILTYLVFPPEARRIGR